MRVAVIATVVALLTGCAGKPVSVALAPPPPAALAPVPTEPAPTPINAGLSPAATLWHLRAGLNVAALACRGPEEATLVARYNALLAREAVALKAAETAYAAEYQASGGQWRDRYDDAMTRLYNFFGQARGRDRFCRAAGAVLADLETAPAEAVPAQAAARLASLDHPFAPPWIEVDPRVFGAAPVQVAAR